MFRIDNFEELDRLGVPNLLAQIKFIFYISSSVQTFSSDSHKDQFFQTWCGNYLKFYPSEFFVLYDNDKVYGYLSGCSDTEASKNNLTIPGHYLFADLFNQFPAHLHINFHPDARSKGLGSVLVEYYCQHLVQSSIQGVHLITSPQSQNVSFYRRLNFNYELIREFKGKPQLFLGKFLSI